MINENKGARENAFRILRVLFVTVLLCFVMSAALTAHLGTFSEKIAELEEKGNMDNTIWLLEYLLPILPVIVVAIILTVSYTFGYVNVSSQREKAAIIAIVLLFTYCVLLPIVCARSEGWRDPVPEGEEDVLSVLEKSITWFSVQIVPLVITLAYHLVRASGEKKELCDNEK